MIQIFWINAIVGHTGPTVINDEGMGYPLDDDDLCFISCIAHNTHTQHLESIAVRGLLPRGGGVTIALRAQFFVFCTVDTGRLREPSRIRGSDAVVIIHKKQAMPYCRALANGVMNSRQGPDPGFIDRAWVRRIAHFREEWGSWIEEDRRLTAIDRRAEDVTIAGLCDTLRKGHHHLFKRAIHRLERDLALSVL